MLKYLHGEVKLWKAYWLISIPISLIGQVLIEGFEKSRGAVPLPLALLLLMITAYITIGLFSSALNYNKEHTGIRKIWGFLVMLQIIIGVIGGIVSTLLMFK